MMGQNITDWISLGSLIESETNFSNYRHDIGVYRANLNGEVVYIGKATELENGGFRKRLRDYTRVSDSARRFPAGQKMYLYRNEIRIEIRIFPRSNSSILLIENLERQLILEMSPKWNSL